METKIKNKKIIITLRYSKYILLLFLTTCAIVGIFFMSYYNPNIQKQLSIRDKVIEKMTIEIDSLKAFNKSLLNEAIKTPCKVGYSAELKNNQISVYSNNRLGLKRGDRILIINEFGLNRISTECVVSIVENSENTNSDADLFLSKDCIRLLTTLKKIKKEGVFNMYFRKITIHYD